MRSANDPGGDQAFGGFEPKLAGNHFVRSFKGLRVQSKSWGLFPVIGHLLFIERWIIGASAGSGVGKQLIIGQKFGYGLKVVNMDRKNVENTTMQLYDS